MSGGERVMQCLSTHGGAGYAPYSYWKGDKIVCGACGEEISNPNPTGSSWVQEKGWRGWLLGRGHWEPRWPNWIMGQRGVASEEASE